jgi:hypothetical protein
MMPMSDDQGKVTDREWAQRILCSDESCIGTIGADGRCSECGKRYEGELPSGLAEGEQAGEADTNAEATEATDMDAAEEEDLNPVDDEWANRRLCSDGNCIGVIGRDGRCKECGKKADASDPSIDNGDN